MLQIPIEYLASKSYPVFYLGGREPGIHYTAGLGLNPRDRLDKNCFFPLEC